MSARVGCDATGGAGNKKTVSLIGANQSFAGWVWLALGIAVFCLVASRHSRAADLELRGMGVRTQIGEKTRVLGEEQPESFYEYDIVASFQMPWERQIWSGWGARARLQTHAGVLRGSNNTGLVVSAIPALAFGKQGGQFKIEMGVGLAWLSRHRFDRQDFGGPLQFALTFGAGAPLSRRVEAGYRFMHYSDAGVYGTGHIGADSHMVELIQCF